MTDTTTTAVETEERASLWEDFLDIYYAPRSVFARRDPGRWPLVLVLLTLVMGALFYASQQVLAPAMEAEFARAMQGNADLSPEQMEQARSMAGIFGLVGILVAFPIGVILTGLLLWAVGKLFDSAATVAAALLIAAYAQFPRLIGSVLALVQGMVMDPADLRSIHSVGIGPARFLDPDAVAPVLLAMASRLDLLVLWSTVLLAIGLQVLGRVPRVQAYLAAALVWLLSALPTLAGSLGGPG